MEYLPFPSGSGFGPKAHIWICIISPDCNKGVMRLWERFYFRSLLPTIPTGVWEKTVVHPARRVLVNSGAVLQLCAPYTHPCALRNQTEKKFPFHLTFPPSKWPKNGGLACKVSRAVCS